MPRATKDEILNQIKLAIVQNVAQKGIGATSVLDIAKAAKISVGTIYNHYADKDEMLQKNYLRIKHEFHASLIDLDENASSSKKISQMWRNLFAYLHDNPFDFMFLEYTGAAQILTDAQKAEVAPLQNDINRILQTAIEDRSIRPIPLDVLTSLLIGPAMHLARSAVMLNKTYDDDIIDQTFSRIWTTLSA